ncbi:DUF4435 domain-containing protein [Epilithonimonas mollis]|uniref:DUF4435 domain-containing protein n=1 Tax=Epilithonimonas mollis TaxID=216903 RepID=A0A1M6NDJ7_9FLAO|nr:DUF4435 domain-containing protein [Epilithonimonas mollis]SHJ93775.1 Protein of unknown function [Epilithonimonas mollis]
MGLTVEDLLREKEKAASVAYQSFVLLTNISTDSLFCFFENKDAPYYHLRIKTIYKGDFHYISCGNKTMVKKTFDLIKGHKEYDKYKLAFFIDKDFDESIKNKFIEIYETPSYSIENLYCNTNSIKELIKTDFQIGEDNPIHSQILDLYQNLQSDFLKASLLFNAWYKLQKIKNKELNQPNNVSLSDSLIPSYIELSLESITPKYTIESILEKYPDSLPYTADELTTVINELNAADLRMVLRGKYVFNFMTTFIRKLIEDGADTSKRKILKKKVKYNMDNSTALTLLTCYAETPECLTEFLTKYN